MYNFFTNRFLHAGHQSKMVLIYKSTNYQLWFHLGSCLCCTSLFNNWLNLEGRFNAQKYTSITPIITKVLQFHLSNIVFSWSSSSIFRDARSLKLEKCVQKFGLGNDKFTVDTVQEMQGSSLKERITDWTKCTRVTVNSSLLSFYCCH